MTLFADRQKKVQETEAKLQKDQVAYRYQQEYDRFKANKKRDPTKEEKILLQNRANRLQEKSTMWHRFLSMLKKR
jgi:hypothetical protein